MTIKQRKHIVTVINELKLLVDTQAEDEGLWFIESRIDVAYIQQELRRLTAVVERLWETQ